MPARVNLDLVAVKTTYEKTGSSRATGKVYKVTGNTILNRLREIGYPIKPRGGPNHCVTWVTKEEAKRVYMREGTYEGAARKLLVSPPTVKKLVMI